MQGEMLAQQLRPDAGILDLVGRNPGPLVGGDVAHAVAAGLHPVQSGAREIGHGVGQLRKLDPVELDVLPGGEVAVIAVVAPGDMRQHAQLVRRERAVGNGDAQHVGMQLQIDAVHQPQRLELFLRELAGEPATDLAAELAHALGHQRAVEIIVDVHRCPSLREAKPWMAGTRPAMTMLRFVFWTASGRPAAQPWARWSG